MKLKSGTKYASFGTYASLLHDNKSQGKILAAQ